VNTPVTIPANTVSVTQSVTINDDSDSEVNETFTVNLGTPSDSRVTGSSSGTVTITDNDAPLVSLQVQGGGTSVNEGSTLTIEATISPTSGSQTIVNLSTAGTATSGTDYTLSSSITISANSPTGSITLSAVDDSYDESNGSDRPNETIIIDIDNITGSSGALENGTQQINLEILDGDNNNLCVPDLEATGEILENQLTWSLPAGCGQTVLDYDIYWSTSTTVTENSFHISELDPIRDDKDITLYVHGGLDNGTTYYYRIAVEFSTGWVLSTIENAIPVPPQCSITTYSPITDSSLIAYYPFEDNLNDVMNHSNGPYPLSVSRGSASYVQGCVLGKSLYLDGNSYMENTNFKDININVSNFTVSFWAKGTADLNQNSAAVASGNSGNSNKNHSQISYDKRGSNNLMRWSGYSGGSKSNLQADNDYDNGTWYHFVGVYFNDDTAEFWVDGVKNDENSSFEHVWERLRVGTSRGGNNYWKGYIDELKIFNKSLNEAEIISLYQQSLPVSSKTLVEDSGAGIVKWNAVPGATAGYKIFRSTTSPVTTLDEVSSPSYSCAGSDTSDLCTLTSAPPTSSDTYYYRIAPQNINGYGETSNEVEVNP